MPNNNRLSLKRPLKPDQQPTPETAEILSSEDEPVVKETPDSLDTEANLDSIDLFADSQNTNRLIFFLFFLIIKYLF